MTKKQARLRKAAAAAAAAAAASNKTRSPVLSGRSASSAPHSMIGNEINQDEDEDEDEDLVDGDVDAQFSGDDPNANEDDDEEDDEDDFVASDPSLVDATNTVALQSQVCWSLMAERQSHHQSITDRKKKRQPYFARTIRHLHVFSSLWIILILCL